MQDFAYISANTPARSEIAARTNGAAPTGFLDGDGKALRTGLQPFYETLQKALAMQSDSIGLHRAFQEVAFMRRCVLLRAKTLAATPYTLTKGTTVYDSDDGGDLPPEVSFMNGFQTMLFQHEADLALFAWSFVQKERAKQTATAPGQSRAPLGLSWLKASTMSIEKEDFEGGKQVSYTRKTEDAEGTKRAVHIPIDELVLIREPSPFHEKGRPHSDGEAARNAAGALHNWTAFVEGHLGGGLLKDVLFSIEGDPLKVGRLPKDPAPTERKLSRWLRRRKKQEKKEALLVSEFLKVTELGEGLAGLADKALTDTLRQDVCAAFSVPYALVMDQGEMAYHALLGKYVQLYQLCLFFDMRLIEEAYNMQLLAPLGWALDFQTNRIEALQWSEMQKAQAVALLTGGERLLSTEEARKLFGLFPGSAAPASGDGQAVPEPEIA